MSDELWERIATALERIADALDAETHHRATTKISVEGLPASDLVENVSDALRRERQQQAQR